MTTTTEQTQNDLEIATVFINGESSLGFEDDNLGSDAVQASAAEVNEQPDWKQENLEPGDVLDLSDGLVRVDDQLDFVNPDKEDEQQEQGEQQEQTSTEQDTVQEEQQERNDSQESKGIKQKLASIPHKRLKVAILASAAVAVWGTVYSVFTTPFPSLLFDVVGIGSAIWFIYRYLSTAEGRENLENDLHRIWKRVWDWVLNY
jgi:hypothetical protein